MPAGLTPTGFQVKTLAEILAEIEADELATIDAELDTSSDTHIGQLNGIMAGKLAECWELLETAYGAFDESKCEASLLDALCAVTGTYREGETFGTVVINCTLLAGTALTAAHIVGKAGDDTNRWHLKTAFTAPLNGTYPLTFECTRSGPIEATTGTLTVIKTAVAGWTAATNPSDAEPGRLVEEDPDLRIRRREELLDQGSCTLPAQGAACLRVPGVESVTVYENTSMVTDADGMPAKSFEVVIWDGVALAAVNADVWQAIYDNKPAGIYSHGAIATTKVDEYGNAIAIAFTRATQVPIFVVIQVAIRTGEYPLDGDAQVKAAIIDGWKAVRKTGRDVYRLGDVAKFAGAVPGVKDIPSLTLATGAIPAAAANIPIGKRSIATFDTVNITVTTVEASV